MGGAGAVNVVIWHNPRCSKSRAALAILRDRGVEPEIVAYLKTPPDVAALRDAVARLGLSPRDLLRKGEAIYHELGLADPALDDAAILKAMAEHPVLIERPVVFAGERAVIGRPPERVAGLF